MAVARRSFGDIRENDPGIGNDDEYQGQVGEILQGLFDTPEPDAEGKLFDRSGAGGVGDAGAQPVTAQPGPQQPPVSGGEGNREGPREVFQHDTPRTPLGNIPMDEIMQLLPQGVEARPSAEATGMGAGSVPGLPAEPSPMSARHMPPAMALSESTTAAPARNTFSSPSALFTGGGQQGLGRIGGFSLPGQSQGGPQATKAMLELVRQLSQI